MKTRAAVAVEAGKPLKVMAVDLMHTGESISSTVAF